MKYVLAPSILAKSSNAAVRLSAAMTVSRSRSELSPTATQWLLNVVVSTNRHSAPFDVVENLLRSFLAGSFCTAHSTQKYEQTRNGFAVTFAPENLHALSGSERPEVERVDVEVEFAHVLMSHESVFAELLQLADYGFDTIVRTLATMAPLVFDKQKREHLVALTPLLRPIALSLKLDPKSAALESVCERGLPSTPSRLPSTPSSSGFQAPLNRAGRAAARARRQVTSRATSTNRAAGAAQGSLSLIDPSLRQLRPFRSAKREGAATWYYTGAYFADKVFEHRQFIVLTDYGEDVHQPFFLNTLAC